MPAPSKTRQGHKGGHCRSTERASMQQTRADHKKSSYGCSGGMTGEPQGLQPARTEQQQTVPAKKFYEHKPASGEMLVIMRYKKEMDRPIRNWIIRSKGRTRQYGPGVCLGVSDKVHVLQSTGKSDWGKRDDWCIAVFLFPNEAQAHLWYISEPELKQHDFLPASDGVQLFATHLRYLPERGKMTFNWVELHNVHSSSYLQREYVDKTAELFDDHSVNHGVIFVQDPSSPSQMQRFKDAWLPYNADAYCVLNLFDDEQQFFSIYKSDQYQSLCEKRAHACDTLSLLFTIDPDITGPPSTK